jgi:hypothetical protein
MDELTTAAFVEGPPANQKEGEDRGSGWQTLIIILKNGRGGRIRHNITTQKAQ